jgi:DNA-binding transcriptional LysR family regulator
VLDLNDFRIFAEVVDRGGFSAAARTLERSVSTLSHRVQQLERELGLPLLVRTSRSIALTAAGEEFYANAIAMLERADEAESAIRNRSTEPVGTVRYTVPTGLAQYAMPEMISAFLAEHPRINLVQHASDDVVDLIAERYDLAIRVHTGDLPDSTLVQRSFAQFSWHLFASPDYLRKAGRPERPEDLHALATLHLKRRASLSWRLTKESGSERIVQLNLKPRMVGTCMLTLKRAAEAHLGVVALPAYACTHEIAGGKLERVLHEWTAGESTVSAIVPSRKGIGAAVRVFLEYLGETIPRAVHPKSTCERRVLPFAAGASVQKSFSVAK